MVANAVVAVSSASGSSVHVPDITTFYGDESAPSIARPLPDQPTTGQRGTFHAIEIPTGDDVFVQV